MPRISICSEGQAGFRLDVGQADGAVALWWWFAVGGQFVAMGRRSIITRDLHVRWVRAVGGWVAVGS
eukprot:6586199-Alexandrium_andersonii.AAC.1